MGFLEDNHFSANQLAFWIPALAWCGGPGKMETHGARMAAKLTKAGTPWTLCTGGDLRDQGVKWAKDVPKDAIFLVEEVGSKEKSKLKRTKIGDDAGKWKGHVKDAMKGAFNGGVKYDAWVEKNRKVWSGVIIGVTVAATVVVSIVATPAAGAAVAAAGSAAAAAVKAGDSTEALETLADSETLSDAAVAAGADPATVQAISDAASTIDAALSDAPAPSEPETVQEPVPVLPFFDRVGQLIDQGFDYAKEHPGQSAVGAGLVLLSFLTGRRLL